MEIIKMENRIGIVDGLEENEKVEVVMEPSGERLHIRLLSWGEGVGWYPQKTIALDHSELEAFQGLLNQAKLRSKIRRQTKTKLEGKVIPFPLHRRTRDAGYSEAGKKCNAV